VHPPIYILILKTWLFFNLRALRRGQRLRSAGVCNLPDGDAPPVATFAKASVQLFFVFRAAHPAALEGRQKTKSDCISAEAGTRFVSQADEPFARSLTHFSWQSVNTEKVSVENHQRLAAADNEYKVCTWLNFSCCTDRHGLPVIRGC